ncbi:MAG: carboxylating nicotinate-nucleotide diphosphorylase [Gammaproteobacteria bacterium]
MIDKKILIKSVKNALKEDCVNKDLSHKVLGKEALKKINTFLTNKEELVLSGIDWFNHSFKLIDNSIKVKWYFKEGDVIPANQKICKVSGTAKTILSSERTAINFIQFMSGISTKAKSYLHILNNEKIQLLDTRKTLPGLRYEQKYATKIAGIKNHRFSLSDGMMLKDNHLKTLGGVDSINYKHDKTNKFFFEIEVKKINEIEPALSLKPDILMFDNFSLNQIKKGIKIVNQRAKIEVSGLKNEKDLTKLSQLKIDFISMGDLTKNIKSIDFSLNIV